MKVKTGLLALVFIVSASVAMADSLAFASVFTDYAMIQRDVEAPVWGTAEPFAEITVTVERDGVAECLAVAVVGEDGRWQVLIPPVAAGGPYSIALESSSGETLAIKDILFGEIWICSGQSNMEMAYTWGLTRGKEDIETAQDYRVRLLNVPNQISATPLTQINTVWTPCESAFVKKFSACGYFFGAALRKAMPDVPIGLIDATWSGTYIQTWLSANSLDRVETKGSKKQQAAGPNSPSACYNGMIAPLFPMAVRGAIWYQGCANVGEERDYARLFPAMVADWRAHFSGGDFPFYLVQLASFMQTHDTPFDSAWARMRWTLLLLGETVLNSGTAVAIDVGDHNDIHPKDKKTVGERLSRLALHRTYGFTEIVEAGPIPIAATMVGDQVRISFKNADGLKTSDEASVSGFQLVDSEGVAGWVQAWTEQDQIVIPIPKGTTPRIVRFAWDDYPVCNLVNGEGLPCGPFQLDLK